MIQAFITLFSNADIYYYIIMAFATIMLVSEVFIPSFGVVGISGLLMAGCGITIRCMEENLTTLELIMYVVYSSLIIAAIVLIVKLIYILIKRKLKKEKLILKGGVVVNATKEGNPDYSFLIGKKGKVVSDLKPSGKAEIDGKVYDVTSVKEYIYQSNLVKVIKIENTRIIVEKI